MGFINYVLEGELYMSICQIESQLYYFQDTNQAMSITDLLYFYSSYFVVYIIKKKQSITYNAVIHIKIKILKKECIIMNLLHIAHMRYEPIKQYTSPLFMAVILAPK